jgi:putative glutamine amidotransferase
MGPRVGVSRWEDIPGERIEAYWERLSEAGLEPVDLHGPEVGMAGLSGLVLTGGVDVDPGRYGQQRHERVRNVNPERDEYELGVVAAALQSDLPLLAICRGHQLLTVAMGGSLLQHIDSGEHAANYRVEGAPSRSHEISVIGEGRLAAIYGSERMVVNSRHHQAVTGETLASGLRAVAFSDDGIIEGVEADLYSWVVGVQWHPEREEPELPGFLDGSLRLFQAFAEAVRHK